MLQERKENSSRTKKEYICHGHNLLGIDGIHDEEDPIHPIVPYCIRPIMVYVKKRQANSVSDQV